MDKGKVTAKVNLTNVITVQSRPPSRPHTPSRPKPPLTPSPMLAEPTFRPKAKVSSSAAIVIGRTSSSSSGTGSPTVKSTTRPPSPSKPTYGHARKLSSTRSAIDVQLSRPKAPLAAHELSRQRSLTSTLGTSSIRARRSSGSFHPASSTPSSPRLSSDNPPTNPTIRVKAKVSSVVKSNGFAPASSSNRSSPPLTTIRPTECRPGAHTTTDVNNASSRSPSPTIPTVPFTIHPITTPTSAANPHRYAPRIAPHTASARFNTHSFSPPSNREPDNNLPFRVSAKVDPAAIPLPPQSPPTSTLSFSSQSSKHTQDSSASGSTAPTPSSHIHTTTWATGERSFVLGSGTTFDAFDDLSGPNSPRFSPGSPVTNGDQDTDRKTRAEAKTNRKIEDLEITNRSLLAINATLEATKHKQAKEIRELRRKLRESRLMLPPPAFRAIKSSLGPEDIADDEDIDGEDDDDNNNNEDADEHDEAYRRVKGILEGLLETGRRALRAEPRDFEKQGGGVKVLSAEEVRFWRGDIGDDKSSIHSAPTEAETDEETHLQQNPQLPSRTVVSGDSEMRPRIDDDERTMAIGGDEHNTGTLPPITVTFS